MPRITTYTCDLCSYTETVTTLPNGVGMPETAFHQIEARIVSFVRTPRARNRAKVNIALACDKCAIEKGWVSYKTEVPPITIENIIEEMVQEAIESREP